MSDGGSFLLLGAVLAAAIFIDWLLVYRLRRRAKSVPPKESVSSRPSRIISLLDFGFGAFLIYWGQSLVSNAGENSYPLSQWLNENFHLAIENLDNILLGLPLIWAGCFFIVRLLLRLKVFGQEKTVETHAAGELPFGFVRGRAGWGIAGSLLFGIVLVLLANKQYNGLLPFLWLAALILFAVWAWKWDRRSGVTLSPNLTRKDLLWMTGLVLAGVVITSFRLQDLPNQMMGDEGTFWTTARDIASGKYQPPIFGLGVYTFGVLSSIFQGMVLQLFGSSFWSWRFSSVLAGVAAIPPLYLLSRELFNRKVAVASSVAMLTAPYFLAFARLGYNNIQTLFVVSLSFYLFWVGMRRSSAFYLFLGGAAAGLGAYTYNAASGAFYSILLFLACGLLFRPRRWRLLAKTGLVVYVGWVLVSGPFTVSANAYNPGVLSQKPLESIFINNGYGYEIFNSQPEFSAAPRFDVNQVTLFFSPDLVSILFLRGAFRSLIAFNSPFLVNEHFIFSPLAGPAAVLFFMIGLAFALARFRQKRFLFLLLWFGLNLLIYSVIDTFPPRHQHLVGIIPLIAILIGLGMVTFLDLAAGLFPRLRGRVQNWLLALLVLGIGASGLYNYFVTMPAHYLPSFEQIVNWNALYSRDQSIYYLYNSNERADFKPYILREVRQDVPYQAIPIDDFIAHSGQYALPQNALIFYSNTSASMIDVLPALRAAYGAQSQEQLFFNHEGEQVGRMAWFGPAPNILPAGLEQSLFDSYNHPNFWLFVLLAAMLVLLAVFRRSWLNRAPAWLGRIVYGITRPEAAEPIRPQPKFLKLRPVSMEPPALSPAPLTEGLVVTPQPASECELLPAVSLENAGGVEPAVALQPAPASASGLPAVENRAGGPTKEAERPFIEIEFRLRINLPWRGRTQTSVFPRPGPARPGPAAGIPIPRRLSEPALRLGTRAAQGMQAFLAQNGWFPAFLLLVAVCLAAFGQIELMEHKGPEPGIWYLLLGGVVFGLTSLITSYTVPLPAWMEQTAEYWIPSSSLRIRLACAGVFVALVNLFILQKRPNDQPHWDIFACWIASVLLFLLALIPRPHFKRPVLHLKSNWQTLLSLGLILLAGFALRFYQLGIIPAIMENDEGKVGTQAVAVLNGGLMNMFQTFEGYGTMHFFLMALPIKLLGQTILAVRLETAFLGLLTLPLIFWLGREMFGCKVALVSTALLAVAHLHFHFSRVSPSAGSLDPLLSTLSMLLLYRGIRSRRAIDWALAGTVMGLGMYFYVGARVLIFILAGFLILLLVFNRRLVWENWRNILVLAGAYLVISAPMLLWASINPGAFNARANQVGIIQNGWLAAEMLRQGTSAIQVLAAQLGNSFLIFNYYFPAWFYEAQVPGLGPITGLAFVFGILAAMPRLRDARFALLNSWFWVTLIIGQVLVVDPSTNAYRTLGLMPAVCIVAGLTLVRLTEAAFEHWPRISKTIPVVILSLALLFETGWNTWNYFHVWAPQNRYSDVNSRLASLIGEYLGQQPPGTQAYVAETPGFRANGWYSLGYLRQSTSVEDLEHPLAEVIDSIQFGTRTIFIFPAGQDQDLETAQAFFPGGQVFQKYLGEELYFTAYIK